MPWSTRTSMGRRCISFTFSDSLFLTMQLVSEAQSTTDCGGDWLGGRRELLESGATNGVDVADEPFAIVCKL